MAQTSSRFLFSWGWKPVVIPPVEKTKTYIDILGELPEDMLTTSLGLSVQYDPTCSVLRMWSQGLLPKDRVFYYASVCRGGGVSHQIGLELMGSGLPDGEIEVITTLLAVLENMGVKDWRVAVAPPGFQNIMTTPNKLSEEWLEKLSPLLTILGERIVVGGVFPKNMSYYKEFRFLIFAKGCGLPVGGGGRYDGAADGVVGVGGYIDVDKIGEVLCLP